MVHEGSVTYIMLQCYIDVTVCFLFFLWVLYAHDISERLYLFVNTIYEHYMFAYMLLAYYI